MVTKLAKTLKCQCYRYGHIISLTNSHEISANMELMCEITVEDCYGCYVHV